jgi:hypothetical protein
MEVMEHYLEYCDLFENYTSKELEIAWKAIHNSDLQEELYEQESSLLAFLIDTNLQEKLHLYFEDLEKDKLKELLYDL